MLARSGVVPKRHSVSVAMATAIFKTRKATDVLDRPASTNFTERREFLLSNIFGTLSSPYVRFSL